MIAPHGQSCRSESHVITFLNVQGAAFLLGVIYNLDIRVRNMYSYGIYCFQLNDLLFFFQGGVLPNIQAILLPKKTEGSKSSSLKSKAQSQDY